jgi:hypothetical protein
MIPMMRPIDELDPIPTEVMRAPVDIPIDPPEWKPVKDKPHMYVNSKGQKKYAPPENELANAPVCFDPKITEALCRAVRMQRDMDYATSRLYGNVF